ncbi:MAG: DUF4249 domain-containing protein [Bacteroidales bacterium]
MGNVIPAFYLLMALAVFSGLTSCQKVISLDLNSASPQLVVEANVLDLPGPYFVKLTKTVNFTDITEIPAVTDAVVTISDSSGTRDTLAEMPEGIYQTSTISGIPGHEYKLTINTGGQVYESVSSMPYPVGFASLYVKSETEAQNPFRGNTGQNINYVVYYQINDPAQYKNFYRFVIFHNNRNINSRRVFSDQYNNGKIIEDQLTLRDTVDFNPGDTIRIELQNIDEGTYDFYRTLREGTSGMSFLSASPSNPISNVSNNALGYFSAYSVNEGMVVIPGN